VGGKQRSVDHATRRSRRRPHGRADTGAPGGPPPGAVPVDPARLAAYNSYGQPVFQERGYYVDVPFVCVDCGVDQVWTATQQKWWYEVAKGYVYSTAVRCGPCRRAHRPRR
jgi:hypothetical protein